VGPRAVLDAVVKRKIPSPRRESNPRTPIVQPVAQRYTDLNHRKSASVIVAEGAVTTVLYRSGDIFMSRPPLVLRKAYQYPWGNIQSVPAR
jgi:hypothetical protein